MRTRTAILVILVALMAPLILACSEEAPAAPDGTAAASPASTSESTAVPSTVTSTPTIDVRSAHTDEALAGIAGMIPPHFPDSSDADWLAFFAVLPSLGGTLGNYAPLDDLEANQQVAQVAGVETIPITGFHRDAGAGLEVTVDFADEAERTAYLDDLRAFAAMHRPRYLGVGNEVNRAWAADAAAFDAWVAHLPELVEAVHEVSPETQVFATFQYEFLRGFDAITGASRVEDWTPFDLVAPHLDLVGFTSYPYFEYASPEEVPADYYDAIREHTDLPVGFSEVGWPSAPLEPLVGTSLEGLGGTPEEQVAFVERLPALLADVEPAFAMWVWAYDTPAVEATFASLGLHDSTGEAKPAAAAWRRFVAEWSGKG